MYAAGKVSPRWPRFVREHAVDYRSERGEGSPETIDTGRGPIDVDEFQAGASEHQPEASELNADADGLLTDADGLLTDADGLLTDADGLLTDPEDELFLLGERCAQAYMQADALQYQAMRLLAEFHQRKGWEDTGFSSTAEWLAWRIGITAGAARERVRTALALETLPQISQAMGRGELSFAKVRTLTRAARPDNEAELLDFARVGSAANLERVVRAWKLLDRKSEISAEQIRHRSRRFSAFVDDDGMVVVRGRLDPEVGAVFMRAVEAASDALYRNEWESRGEWSGAEADADPRDPDADADLPETTPEQRRADAVGLIAERALAAGFGEKDGDAVVSGSRAERYQVMLHVDGGTLEEDGEPGRSELEDGTRVAPALRSAVSRGDLEGRVSAETSLGPLGSAETSRRLACDASRVKVTHGPKGEVLGAGRRTRTVNPSIRRALEARDLGCRFPGCGLRFTEAHHVKHWADGGETSLRNMVLLCRKHHRAVHEGGVRVCIDLRQQVVFFTPRGKALLAAPPRGEKLVDFGVEGTRGLGEAEGLGQSDVLERLPGAGEAGGIGESGWIPGSGEPDGRGGKAKEPDFAPGAPLWKRDSDIPWAVEARAWEALDSG